MKCCTRSRLGEKRPVIPEAEKEGLLSNHQKAAKFEQEHIEKRLLKTQKGCISCACVCYVAFFLVASVRALRGAVHRGAVWELIPAVSRNELPVVSVGSHENHLQVLQGKAADLSGVWWWRKEEELLAMETFFRPTGKELGVSFANVSYPRDFQMTVRLNSKSHTFYTEAGYFWWLITLFTYGLIDGSSMNSAVWEDPLAEVLLEFSQPALDTARVTRISDGSTFWLAKLDDHQWLQTSGVDGYSAANATAWANDLGSYGLKTSGYVLTRIILGGSAPAQAMWWSVFTEKLGTKRTLIGWDTDNWHRRFWSQYLSWAGVMKYSFPFGWGTEPKVPAMNAELFSTASEAR